MSPHTLHASLTGGVVAVAAAAAFLAPSRFHPSIAPPQENTESPCRVLAPTPIEAGRYLVQVAGCNDCHTPGYAQLGSAVPEEEWLTGVSLGWRGPWGTTYASNLRLFAQETPLDVWLAVCADRAAFPPMPWDGLHVMSESDRSAIHAYLLHLGPAGERSPERLDPGIEPDTPFVLMDPSELGFRRVYAPAPTIRTASVATPFEVLGLTVRIRVPSEDTRDALSIDEETLGADRSTSSIALAHHDAVIDVRAGTLEVRFGTEVHTVGKGQRVVVPRGTAHALRNVGAVDARFDRITSPGGFDEFLRELAALAPDAAAARAELFRAYGVEVAGT